MNKQAIMDAMKRIVKSVNRTPGELDRAINEFEKTVDAALEPQTKQGKVPPAMPSASPAP